MIFFLIALCLLFFLNLFSAISTKKAKVNIEEISKKVNTVIQLSINKNISEISNISEVSVSEVEQIITLHNNGVDTIDIIYITSKKQEMKQEQIVKKTKIKELVKNLIIVLCIMWFLTLLKG